MQFSFIVQLLREIRSLNVCPTARRLCSVCDFGKWHLLRDYEIDFGIGSHLLAHHLVRLIRLLLAHLCSGQISMCRPDLLCKKRFIYAHIQTRNVRMFDVIAKRRASPIPVDLPNLLPSFPACFASPAPT